MSISDLTISAKIPTGIKSPPGSVKELLLPPKIRENSVILEIKPDVNLTGNALHRNKRILKAEILEKAGKADVVILQIGNVGIDNAGYKFLIDLDRELKSEGKILILFTEDEVSLKGMSDLPLPIVVSNVKDLEKVTSSFAA